MRVALHTPFVVHKNTGIARHIFGLLRGLAEVDTKTEYICFWPPDEPWPDWLPANFRREPLTIAGDNPLARVLKEQSWMARAHKRLGFDVLHSPFGYLPPRPPCPAVVTVHDCRWARYPQTFTRLRGTFLRWAIPRAVRQAKVTVAISEETRREILHFVRGASPERVRVLYPGMDAFWLSPPEEKALEKMRGVLFPLPPTPDPSPRRRGEGRNNLVGDDAIETSPLPLQAGGGVGGGGQGVAVLAVGTHEPHKNLPNLLRAFAQALPRLPQETRLYLIGVRSFSTGKSLTVEKLFYEYEGLEERVDILGAIGDEDLKAAYHLADALCFPSFYEGFGYPPLEAMACGTPVITSRASCIPEVVGDAAELANPHSPPEIADALVRVLTSPTRQTALRERGDAQFRRYTWRSHAEGVIAAYREAANTQP